jgi:dCMP deaminase
MIWDKRFLELAELISTWSKDPSTKTGSVIVRPDKTIASVGFNGFPRGIEDKPELLTNREEKLKRVIHAELNAMLSARERLDGYTIYIWPLAVCSRCATHIIQAGIKKVVVRKDSYSPRWEEENKLAAELFKEAKVELVLLEDK